VFQRYKYKPATRTSFCNKRLFTTMADTTTAAGAADNMMTALADVDIPPYFTGAIALDRNVSTLFYRTGDKAEYVVSSKPHGHACKMASPIRLTNLS
jgi:hypothetical protein